MLNWSLYFYALIYTIILSIVYWLILSGPDDNKNYDNLIFILYNVVFATTVINFVEPKRLLLFENILHVHLKIIKVQN